MLLKLAKRMLFETDKRLLWKLAWNMGFKGMLSVERHKRRLKRGEVFPPFLYVSIINSCNLRCQGCWVDVAAKQETIKPEAFDKLVREAKAMGNVFFGVVGGEPFMHPHLIEMLAAHPDCYFQVFTNGQFITDAKAKELRRLGNVTPLISVEGNEIVSDERRGRAGVYSKTMAGVQNCLKNKVFTGVCTSLCQTNIDDLLTEKWVDRLIEMGVLYTWFHVYRPMGPDANPQLCLTPEQQLQGAAVRVGDAGEEADHHRGRLFRRRGPGALPRGYRHHEPHQPVGRHRAVPDHPVHEGVDPFERGRPAFAAREVSVGIPARLPHTGPIDDARLHRAGAAGPVEAAGREARRPRRHGARHGPGGAGGDGGAHVAVQPRQRGPGEELDVPPGEALLVQRLRRLPRTRPQPDIGAGVAARRFPPRPWGRGVGGEGVLAGGAP